MNQCIKTKIIFVTVLCMSFSCLSEKTWAACSWSGNLGTVASPYTISDVQDCVGDASSKTGNVTVDIPDSNTTWSSSVSVDMRSGWTSVTGLTLRGQNDCSLFSNASPSFDYPISCGTNINNFSLNYTGKEGKDFRLAHFRATGTSGITIDGDGKSWRFDHFFGIQ